MFYGWGLVCLKHRKWYEAQTSFNRATQLADARYLPAWEASARTQLLQQNASAAMSTLLKMAPLLADKDNSMLTQAQKKPGAGWVGRAMFCVETNWRGLPTWRSVKKEIEQKDSKFEGLFHDKLWMAYENGRHGANQKAQAVEQRDESTPTPRAHDSTGETTQKGDQLQDKQERLRQATANLEKQLDDGFNTFQNCYIELESSNAQLQVGDEQLDWDSGTSRWSQPSRSWAAMAQSGWCRSRHRPTGTAPRSKFTSACRSLRAERRCSARATSRLWKIFKRRRNDSTLTARLSQVSRRILEVWRESYVAPRRDRRIERNAKSRSNTHWTNLSPWTLRPRCAKSLNPIESDSRSPRASSVGTAEFSFTRSPQPMDFPSTAWSIVEGARTRITARPSRP